MKKPVLINYIYFGILFIILSAVHCTHAQVIEQGSGVLKAAFVFYALSQSLLEVGFLALIGSWIGKLARGYQWAFVGITLILLLMHLIDFPLVRFMDLSIWQALGLVLGETFENFIEMLYATHMTMASWIGGALALACIFFLGLAAYRLSERRPLKVPLGAFALLFVFLPLGMFICERQFISNSSEMLWRAHEKALPWKRTLSSREAIKLSLGSPLKPLLSEEKMLEHISALPTELDSRPDIFIFIIESLRNDYLTEVIAPHLTELEKTSTSAAENIASANATQLSWFSAFFGKHPLYFAAFQERGWQSGSPALALLKKWDYEIEVFSATRLAYYKMDELIFGKNLQLADALHLYPSDDLIPAYESDRKTIHRLIERATEERSTGGRCYIVFLESTHFGYSWPPEMNHFKPFSDQINYLELLVSKQRLESVQNRYRNAIHYLDSLFGEFASALKLSGKWEESVIALTGDHGEEFYEEGHLFHASNLNKAQTRVPLLFKLGARPKEAAAALGSHVDLFPTLFHHLLGNETTSDLFDGQSILCAKKWPYTLTGRYNGSRSPYEFCIEKPHQKLIVQLTAPHALFQAQDLRILEVRSTLDHPTHASLETIEHEFRAALDHLFCN